MVLVPYSAAFLALAIVAALFGFSGAASGGAAAIARTMSFVFLLVCVVIWLLSVFKR